MMLNRSQNLNIEQQDFDRIADLIHSDASPVGIDAKKTHIIIIHKLEEILKRLAAIEAGIASQNQTG